MVNIISMSQEEIIANTKTVVQGLEALKNENCSILSGLLQSLKMVKETSKGDVNTRLMEEKASIIKKSIESIELGLNEAHVSFTLHGLSFAINYGASLIGHDGLSRSFTKY